jgi:hypothetical protein
MQTNKRPFVQKYKFQAPKTKTFNSKIGKRKEDRGNNREARISADILKNKNVKR